MRSLIHTLLLILTVYCADAQTCVPITLDCPDDITITADPGGCTEIVHYDINTIGDCPLTSITQTDNSGLTSGDEFPIGSTMQSYVSLDNNGNTDTCSFLIIILEFPNPITSEACNNSINLSPGADCEVLVTADMILEGGPYGCYENYIVTITTQSGDPVPNPITTPFVGQTLIATVTDPNGVSCWGFINYEDYIVTPLECQQYTIDCRDDLLPSSNPADSVGFPIPSGFVITPGSGAGPFVVEDYDNCGDINLSFTDQLVEIDCTIGGPFTRIIYRTWTATDGQGNSTMCVDTINVRIPNFSSTNIFPNRNGTEAPSILCSGNWDSNGDGIPQPEEIGDELNMNCDIWGEYVDIIHYLNCGVLIDRKWDVVNMCTGELVSFVQQIKLEDDEAPEIMCAPQLIGSTDLFNCFATYHVEAPMISDDCSSVTYTVTSSAGNVINIGTPQHPHYIVENLPIGTYTLTFTAVDGCGNTASCSSQLIIEDQVAPKVNCEGNYTVFLGTGQDFVNVNNLLVFSSDACGIDRVRLRRVSQGNCAGTAQDDLTWHEIEVFCCEEAGQTILIEVGVWDIYGNFSSCISHVFVDNNVAPSLTCPPDISVSCSFPIDTNDLSVFGTIVTDINDVMNVVIDDRDYIENCKGQPYHGPKIWGQDGLALSDCDFDIEIQTTFNLNCGRSIFENGEFLPAIIREFIIRNNHGIINSCVQEIFILDCSPQMTNIDWPEDVVIDACVGGSTDPDDTGRPTISAGSCDEISTSFTDMDVPSMGDTSDCATGMDSVIGEFDQNIYVIKTDSISLMNCADTLTNIGDPDCQLNSNNTCEIIFDITPPDVVDCDTSTSLGWEIDFDFSGTFTADANGSGLIQPNFPFGTHVIRWRAMDMCGGEATCETVVIAVDCEPPVALCQDIGIQVLPDSNGVVISADDIANISVDNCGEVTAQFLICEGRESIASHTLYGTLDNKLIILDTATLEITVVAELSSPLMADVDLTYNPNLDLFFAINDAINNPTLISISKTGIVTEIGPLEVPGETIFFVEALAYDQNSDQLYAGLSLDGDRPGDTFSESIVEVDAFTAACEVFTRLESDAFDYDIDALKINDGIMYIIDVNSPDNYIVITLEIDTVGTQIIPPIQYTVPFVGNVRGTVHDGSSILIAQRDRSFYELDLNQQEIFLSGVTHELNEFNGASIRGLAFVHEILFLDTCDLSGSNENCLASLDLYGLLNDNLIIVDTGTVDIVSEMSLSSSLPTYTGLAYVESDDLFYSIINRNTSPALVSISRTGVVSNLGEFALNNSTIFLTESIFYSENKDQLYISASLDGSVGSGDSFSETILEVNRMTAECNLLSTFGGIGDFYDIDAVEIQNDTFYILDGVPGESEILVYIIASDDINLNISPPVAYTTSFLRIRGTAHDGKGLYISDNDGILNYLDLSNQELSSLGRTHLLSDYNGESIDGLAIVKSSSSSDTCFLVDNITIDCNDLSGFIDTFSYDIIVFDEAGNADTCSGEIIVVDSNEVCKEEPCEFIYAITANGEYYSINTQTGEFSLVTTINGIPNTTNAVAVNAELGIGYFGSDQTVYWIDLDDGTNGVVGDIGVPGSLSGAAGSFFNSQLYLGPETGSVIEDLFRVEFSADGKSFAGPLQNLTNGSTPNGNFGDFVVLDGDVGNERFLLSIFNNIDANNIYEYLVSTNTFTILSTIPSNNSSQITVDNVGNVWYFDNAQNRLGFLNPNTGELSGLNVIPLTLTDMGRSYCPNTSMSNVNDVRDVNKIALFQNTPNPFTDETTIAFYLPRDEAVKINLYTIDGLLIVSESVQAVSGINEWRCNYPLAAGMYVYELQSENGTKTKQMIKF